MNKKFVFFILFIFCVFELTYAQAWRRQRNEYVYSIGATNFLGDVGGSPYIGSDAFSMRDLNWKATRPTISAGYRYRLTEEWAYKTSLHIGMIYGSDKFTKEIHRRNRNITFRSPVIEISGQFDYLMTRQREGRRYKLRGVKGWRNININSYIFLGLGAAFISPQGRYEGELLEYYGKWFDLKSLSTEGQGLSEDRPHYKRLQAVVPIGFGFSYAINRYWAIGFEYSFRKTFSDYIDDTSTTYYNIEEIREAKGDIAAWFADPKIDLYHITNIEGEIRGDPKDKDTYMYAEFTFYYKIPRTAQKRPKFY